MSYEQIQALKKEEVTLENGCVKKLFFKFAIPSVVGMIIVSIQLMVDGLFIANYVGVNGLAAVNLSMPIIYFFTSITLVISSGGSVVAGVFLGKNQIKRYSEAMSFTFLIFLVVSGISSILGLIFLEEIIKFLGVTESLREYVASYLFSTIVFNVFYNLPIITDTFTRLSGKPHLTFFSGGVYLVGNIILNYIFVAKMNLGMKGAALGTCFAAGIAGTIFLGFLDFEKPKGSFKLLKEIIYNGSSEMFTILSSSVTIYIFNQAVLKNIGELGVSALTVIFYINSLVNIIIFGLSTALQPIVSYNLGAKRVDKIYKVLKISLISGGVIGVLSFIFMRFYSQPLVELFSKGDKELSSLTQEVLSYFTFVYIVSFINIISGAFHTALGKPLESVLIATCKSIVFVLIPLFILPKFLGNTGIWLATPIGEFFCLFISLPLMFRSLKNI